MRLSTLQITVHNKVKQHRSLRSLDNLALAPFVHGFAIVAQNSESRVCRVRGIIGEVNAAHDSRS